MWIYYNELRQQQVICPHGEVARQGDGFTLTLALDFGELASKGYSSISLYYQRPSQQYPTIFETINVTDTSKVYQQVFTKLNDSEITYGLKANTKYDTVNFTIHPEDDIVLEKGELKIQFWRVTTSVPQQTLFARTNLYLEQSLNYFDTVTNRVNKSEAKKILQAIENTNYTINALWTKESNLISSEGFNLKTISTHGISIVYGSFSISEVIPANTVIASLSSINRHLLSRSVVHLNYGVSTIIGEIYEDNTDNKIKLRVLSSLLMPGINVSVNGIFYINFDNIFSEQGNYQTPYIPIAGSDKISGDLIPQTTETVKLGDSTHIYNKVYTKEISDGVYDISIAGIANKTKLYKHTITVTNGGGITKLYIINNDMEEFEDPEDLVDPSLVFISATCVYNATNCRVLNIATNPANQVTLVVMGYSTLGSAVSWLPEATISDSVSDY